MPPTSCAARDGVRVFTVDRRPGLGIIAAIEHWNPDVSVECVGWHVCKRGDRFAALQPTKVLQGNLAAPSTAARLYASTSAGAAPVLLGHFD